MIIPILYCSLAVLLMYLYAYLSKSIKHKLPPGSKEAPIEKGLPIIGALYKIEQPIYNYFMKLGKKHGSIFRLNFGMREVFVLNDYEALKICLKGDSENFSGRWNGKYIRKITEESGILFIDGDIWARHRSFMLTILRDFGMGRSRTDEIIQNECVDLLNDLKNTEKEGVDFLETITTHTINIISQFLMKKRFAKEDKDVKLIIDFIRNIMSRQHFHQIFNIMVPQWDNSEFCSNLTYKLFYNSERVNKIFEIFYDEIKRHRERLDGTSEGEDFMDKFLIEQKRIKEKDGSVGSFTDYQLVRSSFEMFVAGFDSTSGLLVWSLLFLSRFPDIQNKMHEEIIKFLGVDKTPSSNDKKSLPYTQAVMDEILRLSSGAPLAVFHRNFHDTVVNDIFIPKNSFIFPNLYACHRDGKVWEKPFEFYPEHFLNVSDDGKLQYRPREELVPFGMGKRQCLGELLARAEYFIFLTSIIQRYTVNFAEEVTETKYQEAVAGGQGAARYSKIKTFVFERYKDKSEVSVD